MSLFIGGVQLSDVGQIKVGNTNVQSVYLGDQQIWPEVINATQLYLHNVVMDNSDNSQWKGRIAVNPANDEIMIIPRAYGYAWFSDDAGVTWTQQGLAGSNTKTSTIRCIQYHAAENTWWAMYQLDGESSVFRYSINQGITWTTLTMTGTNVYRPRGFYVGSDGTLYGGGAGTSSAGQGARIWRRVSPKGANTFNERLTALPQNGTHGHGIIGGIHHWMINGGTKDSISMTPNLAHNSATRNWNTGLIPSSDLVAGCDDYVLTVISFAVTGLVTLRYFDYDSSLSAPPTITYDFARTIGQCTVYHGDGKFILVAKNTIDVNNVNEVFIATMDETTMVWSSPYIIRLPLTMSIGFSMGWMQMEHFKDNTWLVCYNTGTYGTNNYGKFVLAKFEIPTE